MVSGKTFSFLDLRDIITSGIWEAWIPCAIFGTIAYLSVRYSRHYLTLPVLVLASGLIFYGWLGFSHHSLEQARLGGWIIGAPPGSGLGEIRALPSLLHANWIVVLGQYGSFVALLLTSIISILLNTSALELASDEEIDLEQGTAGRGPGQRLAGLPAGMVGFQSLSLSVFPRHGRQEPPRRSLFRLRLPDGALVWYRPARLHPQVHLGGILFYNGVSFLTQWVFDACFRLTCARTTFSSS